MINKLYLYISNTYIPHHNQAIEEYFLNEVNQDSLILYLWQNENTIFIGKNQNPINEINIDYLKKTNAYLARRITGGGAVYHDLGNINFSFICKKNNYDLNKQNQVIINALNKFNLKPYKNGRNDLLINDRKFSGHAYCVHNNNCLHHGTIMIDVNNEDLEKYLNVSLLKLKDKGVASIKSRIINLKELNHDININNLKESIIKSYQEIYHYDIEIIYDDDINKEKLNKYEERFSNPDWYFGKIKQYQINKENKYHWGLVKIEYDLKDDIIDDLIIYTDALNIKSIEDLIDKLKGISITQLKNYRYLNEEEKDIIELLLEDY